MDAIAAANIFLRIEAGSHGAPIESILATSDGRRLITGGKDKTVRVWDVATRTLERTLRWQIGPGRFGEFVGIVLHPDDKTLFVITRNIEHGDDNLRRPACFLRIYDLDSGNLIMSHDELGWISAACFIADGAGLLTIDHMTSTCRAFVSSELAASANPAPWLMEASLPGETSSIIAWSSDTEEKIVVGAWAADGDPGGLALYSLSTTGLKEIKRVVLSQCQNHWAIAASEKRVAVAYLTPPMLAVFDRELNLIGAPVPLDDPPGALAFFDDHQLLVGADGERAGAMPLVFDVESAPRRICDYAGHAGAAKAVAFLNDGMAVSAGGPGNDIHFWRPAGEHGEFITAARGGGRTIFATGMSANLRVGLGYRARQVADANDFAPLDTVFDLASMALLPLATGETAAFARAVVRRADRYLEIHRDPGPRLYLMPAVTPLISKSGNWYYPKTFGFTPNGSIITGDQNGVVRRIALAAGQPRQPERVLRGHLDRVWDHAAQGDWLVTGGQDQIAQLWYLPDVEANDDAPLVPALSLFVAADGEWVIWSASNFFDASEKGERYLGFHVNQGESQEAQFVSVDRFVRLLYRPGVVRAILELGSEARALKHLGLGVPDLAASMPPVIECHDPPVFGSGANAVGLTVEVRPGGGPIRRVWALRNERMVWEDATVRFASHTYQPLTVQLEPGENRFKILAESTGAKSNPITIVVNPNDGTGEERPAVASAPPDSRITIGDSSLAPPGINKPAETSHTPTSGGGGDEQSMPVRIRRMTVEFDIPKGADPGMSIRVTRNGKSVRGVVVRRKGTVFVTVPIPEGAYDITIEAGSRDNPQLVFSSHAQTGALAAAAPAVRTAAMLEVTEPDIPAAPAASGAPSVAAKAPAPVTRTAFKHIKPNLYVLAVGVSAIKHPSGAYKNLQYAAADAVALREAFESQQGRAFEKVTTWELLNSKATLAGINAALREIDLAVRIRDQQKREAGEFARDVTVVFLAGHGVQTSDDRFYFWNHDFDMKDREGTGLSFLDLGNLVTAFPTELLLLIDACHAGMAGAAGIANIRPEELFKRLVDINERAQTIFSATQKNEIAIEHEPFGHGFFTQGLLKTFRSNPAGSEVSVLQLVDATMNAVKIWSSNKQIPSVRVYGDLFRWIVFRS